MWIIKQSTLVKIAAEHPKTKPSLLRWIRLVKAPTWSSMSELQMAMPGALVRNSERASFAQWPGVADPFVYLFQ